MIQLLPMPEATVTPGVPKYLQEGNFVTFTDRWPDTLSWVKGKSFVIEKTNQVPYDLHYIIPTNDFKDVDLSNSSDGEKMYPTNTKTLYQVGVGFKPADMLCDLFIPAGEYCQRLEYASMVPTLSSNTLRYLGAFNSTDTPYGDARLFFYFVYRLEPLIMRLYVDYGIDYEKIVAGFLVNQCYMRQVLLTPEQAAQSDVIRYYTELRW